MSPRIRTPLRPWLSRLYSTSPSAPRSLPSPLQRELFRRVAQPVAVITAHIPELAETPAGLGRSRGASRKSSKEPHNHGATLSSLASISLSPPLVSFSLRLPSRLATFLSSEEEPAFSVHLLSTEQESIARAFARQAPLPAPSRPSPPPDLVASRTAQGPIQAALPPFPPRLFAELDERSLGSMTCRVVRQLPLAALDSTAAEPISPEQPRSELFIAQVEDVRLGHSQEGAASLLYWDQRYAGVANPGKGS